MPITKQKKPTKETRPSMSWAVGKPKANNPPGMPEDFETYKEWFEMRAMQRFCIGRNDLLREGKDDPCLKEWFEAKEPIDTTLSELRDDFNLDDRMRDPWM